MIQLKTNPRDQTHAFLDNDLGEKVFNIRHLYNEITATSFSH